MESSTNICPKCKGFGVVTRYVPTLKNKGYIRMRYSPQKPKFCSCIKTETVYNIANEK